MWLKILEFSTKSSIFANETGKQTKRIKDSDIGKRCRNSLFVCCLCPEKWQF